LSLGFEAGGEAPETVIGREIAKQPCPRARAEQSQIFYAAEVGLPYRQSISIEDVCHLEWY